MLTNVELDSVDLDPADTERHWESPADKSKRNPKSLRLAINAQCAACIGYPDAGWRREIRNCTAQHCGLWNVRPFQTTETDEADTA